MPTIHEFVETGGTESRWLVRLGDLSEVWFETEQEAEDFVANTELERQVDAFLEHSYPVDEVNDKGRSRTRARHIVEAWEKFKLTEKWGIDDADDQPSVDRDEAA